MVIQNGMSIVGVGAWWVGYRYWWTPDRRSAGTGAAGVGARRGGVGTRPLVHDERVLEWVRHAHEGTRFTTSVCTGSLVLAAAGLLDGLTATTHWSVLEELLALGAEPTSDRVVEHLDRRIITAAGVSSGIDMALRLVEVLVDETAAKASQLMIEYDPQPPFDAGALAKCDATVVERVIEYAALRQ